MNRNKHELIASTDTLSLNICYDLWHYFQAMALLARPVKTNNLRKHWNHLHHNIGRLIIGFGISNIFLGLSISHEKSSWYIAYGVCLGAWVVTALSLEIHYRMKSSDSQ